MFAQSQKASSRASPNIKEPTDSSAIRVYDYVEQMPEPGYDLLKYVVRNVHFSDSINKDGIHSGVIVGFIVNEDGSISGIHIIRSAGSGIDEEVKRVVAQMPKWTPGMHDSKPVKVYFTQPFIFEFE